MIDHLLLPLHISRFHKKKSIFSIIHIIFHSVGTGSRQRHISHGGETSGEEKPGGEPRDGNFRGGKFRSPFHSILISRNFFLSPRNTLGCDHPKILLSIFIYIYIYLYIYIYHMTYSYAAEKRIYIYK